MKLDAAQLDRAAGAVVGSAVGDALGSQYEFGPSHPDDFDPVFGIGAFGHGPGEWTDDTSMAVPILRAVAGEAPAADTPAGELAIVRAWIGWAKTAKDVGTQTRGVLDDVEWRLDALGDDAESAARIPAVVAQKHHDRAGRSGGNGSLMRTGPVGLVGLASAARTGADGPDSELLATVAGRIARLTHWEDDNVDACVLWCLAIQHAILTGELDLRAGLEAVPDGPRRERWSAIVGAGLAAGAHPRDFRDGNGWVVTAFESALAAIHGADGFPDALRRAIRGGGDTDTVAAIAGSLAGAFWGASGIPEQWTAPVHGWPGLTADDLAALAVRAVAAT